MEESLSPADGSMSLCTEDSDGDLDTIGCLGDTNSCVGENGCSSTESLGGDENPSESSGVSGLILVAVESMENDLLVLYF